jgi:hypothetical protein
LQGKLTSFSPQTGKFTIRYDDGQSEAVLLERERFLWHSPRAASAGYRPALHSLMQQLGADGVGKLPVTGEDGKVMPETAGPEVRAVDIVHGFMGFRVTDAAARSGWCWEVGCDRRGWQSRARDSRA